MAIEDKVVDAAVANQVQTTIDVVSNSQVWDYLILGTYCIIYPYIAQEFVHISDFNLWVQKTYGMHYHYADGPTSSALPPAEPVTTKIGNSFIERTLGLAAGIRQGLGGISRHIFTFLRTGDKP